MVSLALALSLPSLGLDTLLVANREACSAPRRAHDPEVACGEEFQRRILLRTLRERFRRG